MTRTSINICFGEWNMLGAHRRPIDDEFWGGRMSLGQELKAQYEGTQGGGAEAILRLAIQNESPVHAKLEEHPECSVSMIFPEIIDASCKPWLSQLTSILGRYPGEILYIGRAGDRLHTELTATSRVVTVIDPFEQTVAAEHDLASRYGVIVVPGLAFAAWSRNRGREDFLALVSERLTADGLIVADLPNPALWDQPVTAPDRSDIGRADPACIVIRVDPDGNIDVLDGKRGGPGAGESSGDRWHWVDVKVDEVCDLEPLLASNGFVETYRTPSVAGSSVARMYAFKRRNGAPLCHPFSPLTVSGTPGRVLVLAEGRGCRVRDVEGKEYIDGCGGLWNTHLGLGNSEVIEAITAQLHRLSYATLFAERGHESAATLARELIALAPYPMQWVCYTGSGSESTEVALRIAGYYQLLAGRKDRKRIAYLDESYHGCFAASSCVSGLMPFRSMTAGAVSSVALPTPNPDKCPPGTSYDAFALLCADALEEQAKAGGMAAFIVEPILGSAGVVIPPKAYFERIRAICDRYDILLIVDEVATGFGRTGHWFACEHYDLRPDILIVAKGINSGYAPMGAVLFSAAIGEQFAARGMPLPHGSTTNGNPLCCAAALATLRILERDRLVERAAEMGAFLMSTVGALSDLECVKEVRGLGLMGAVVLQQADGTPATPLQVYEITKRLQTAGILIYPTATTLTLAPALVVTREEIALIAAKMRDVLAAVRLDGGQITPRPDA
jgi:adenosylmethionine-8-amino-7-oxononanoate aminotransferase